MIQDTDTGDDNAYTAPAQLPPELVERMKPWVEEFRYHSPQIRRELTSVVCAAYAAGLAAGISANASTAADAELAECRRALSGCQDMRKEER